MYKLTTYYPDEGESETERPVPDVIVQRFLEAAEKNIAAILVYKVEESDIVEDVTTCPECGQTLSSADE